MRVTSKGQVTIPQEIREFLGILPNSEVEFDLVNGGALLRKAKGKQSRGKRLVHRLQGRGDVKMTTEEIMALTRGDA